ncbi:MAG: hypothetical protein WC732_08420 [Candidatus Omnitrophota bacterium]
MSGKKRGRGHSDDGDDERQRDAGHDPRTTDEGRGVTLEETLIEEAEAQPLPWSASQTAATCANFDDLAGDREAVIGARVHWSDHVPHATRVAVEGTHEFRQFEMVLTRYMATRDEPRATPPTTVAGIMATIAGTNPDVHRVCERDDAQSATVISRWTIGDEQLYLVVSANEKLVGWYLTRPPN